METLLGRNSVREALKAQSRPIHRLLIAEGAHDVEDLFRLAGERGIVVEIVKRYRLDQVAGGIPHQGVVAFVGPRKTTEMEEVLEKAVSDPNALIVVLDHVQDPQNFGAILRTAEGAGVLAVVVPKRNAAPLTSAAIRASAGAAEYLPIVRVANVAQTLERFKASGFWVVGASTEPKGTIPYTDYDFRGRHVLVVGGEGTGLARLVAERCDTLIHIPMRGHIGSLNVAVATGVLLFEAIRKRQIR